MYDRSDATSLTLDELHHVLDVAAINANVTIEVITHDGNRLMSTTTAIMPNPDEYEAGDKDERTYFMFNEAVVDAEGTLSPISEAWFKIPHYYAIRHIDRVDGDGEQTIAVDCEYVYYVVLKDGVYIRIEI